MTNKYEKEVVENKLKDIFDARFDMHLDEMDKQVLGSHFLGSKVGMAPRHLLYLFFDIEKEYGIRIPEDFVVSGKFSTFNNLVDMICKETGREERYCNESIL